MCLNPTVSIIVPIYNASEYLDKCLQSLIDQTLNDIEIICIDDCSTDDSWSIVERYAKKDPRIKAFQNKTNQKQGLTRNRGIDIATGKYVAFVDSDDFVNVDMYERMYTNAVKSDRDICCCFINYHFLNGKDQRVVPFNQTDEDLLQKYLLQRTVYFDTDREDWNKYNPTSPCDKLYKRSFLNKYNIRFFDNRTVLVEDLTFNFQCFINNPSISVEYFYPYNYVRREVSTSTSYYVNFLNRIFNQYQIMSQIVSDSGNSDQEKLILTNYVNNYIYYSITETLLTNCLVYCKNKYHNPILRRLKGISCYYKELKSDTRTKYFFSKEKIRTYNFKTQITHKIIYKICDSFITKK